MKDKDKDKEKNKEKNKEKIESFHKAEGKIRLSVKAEDRR
jgi:hypothetical protein